MVKIFDLLHNKKGMSYISLIVSLVIMLAIVAVLGNFKTYVAQHKHNVNEYNSLSQEINNQIASIYNESDWESLENEIINTQHGDIKVKYKLQGVTEFATSKLLVTFSYKNTEDNYTLERSVYHE